MSKHATVMCKKTIQIGKYTFEEGKEYEYKKEGSFCMAGEYEVYKESPTPWVRPCVFEKEAFHEHFKENLESVNNKINLLEQNIQFRKQEISSFQTLIQYAKELFDNNETTDIFPNHGEDAIKLLGRYLQESKKSLKNLQHELKTYQESVTNKNIGVMFFKAGHRDFRSDEISKMLKDIRKFEEHPIEKDIDFGMSDEAKLFVSEDVEQKEAQAMWKYFCDYTFDKNGKEVMKYGDVLTWNGREFIDDKGIPFETYQN